jgi:hypothetical protein
MTAAPDSTPIAATEVLAESRVAIGVGKKIAKRIITPAASTEATAEWWADLARRVRSEHNAAEAALRTGVRHAMACGDLLLQAKAALGHGRFLPWLKESGVPERAAQRYTRLAKHRDRLEAKSVSVSDLSVTEALRLLAKPLAPEPVKWTGTNIDVFASMRAEIAALAELVGSAWPDAPTNVVLDLRAKRHRTGAWPTEADVIAMREAKQNAAERAAAVEKHAAEIEEAETARERVAIAWCEARDRAEAEQIEEHAAP